MGDPKFSRRKYDTPPHPWRSERIKTETEIQKRFGLKNKREVWKAQSLVRNFRVQSRDLQARLRRGEKQAEIETEQLLQKCGRLGLLPTEGTTINDVLSLNVENVLTRRFQTMVFQKGMAHTYDQARQFIVHGHVAIKGRIVTIPGYLVRRNEENEISYTDRSPLANDLHPMRPKPKDAIELEKEKVVAEHAVKEKPKDKAKESKKKETHDAKHLKAAKPSLEKMLEKDGAKEKEAAADLPEPDEEEADDAKKPEEKPAKGAKEKKPEAKPQKKEKHKKEK